MKSDTEVDLDKANHPAHSDEGQHKVTGQLDTANQPSWMGDAVEYLLTVKGGDAWLQMVQSWVELERHLGYPDREVSP
jgi:hypothetical protein